MTGLLIWHSSFLKKKRGHPLNLKMLKARAEIFDSVSAELHPSAVISQLAGKYGVSEKSLWSDWDRRDKWVSFLVGLEKYGGFSEMMEQKLNAVQKAARSICMKADNDSARVGALRVVLDSLEVHGNIVQTGEVLDRLDRLEEGAEKQKQPRGGVTPH